jgi:hypothetical protein
VVSYKASAEILRKQGLEEVERKKYYNLRRQVKSGGKLTRQEGLQLLLRDLDQEGLYPRSRSEYILDEEGIQTQRVIRDLFWMSLEQIRMARRFVSGFIYETDATFNTNCLKLPLSVEDDKLPPPRGVLWKLQLPEG